MLLLQGSSHLASFVITLFAFFAFLALGVNGEEFQIPLAASEMANEEMEDEFVPVYGLTKLTKEEEDLILAALSTAVDEDDDMPWVKPKIVPWTGDIDGNMDDLYRLYRDMRDNADEETPDFFFFIDRQCLDEKKVIVAHPDHYTLLYAPRNTEDLNEILKTHGSKIPEVNEGIVDKVMEELLERALTYGRIPAHAFRGTWANLDLANMGLSEIVEFHEVGQVELYYNPDWNVKNFIEKAEIANAELEEAEKQKASKKNPPQ